MLKCKRFVWLLLLVGLLHPFFILDEARAHKENAPAPDVIVTDKMPPPDTSLTPVETEKSSKKEPHAEKTNPPDDKKLEEAKNKSRQDEGNNKREAERDMMEMALELLNSSQEYWVKGDIENALEILDQAYAMLLDTNGDIDISRQKDDLRLLISKRILAIYTSKYTVTNGKRSEIPAVMNAYVEREIRSFQTIEREYFISAYQRASFFRPIVLTALKKAGLPEELSWLPLVESGFKIRALSRARALGLWQFIPSTGYKYGLSRDEWIDERMDVEKSTQGAIGYLKDLHEMFGDWLTVLAAYNCGEGRVLRIISRQHINYLDRFWDLNDQLPNETVRYVPRFLATLEIIKDPRKYGMDLEAQTDRQSAYVYETLTTNKRMNLQDIASRIDVSEDLLSTLNAELRYKKTPDREYRLKIPPESMEKLVKVMDEIPQADKPLTAAYSRSPALIRHKVRAGETLSSIAHRYKTTVKAIRTYNKSLRKSILKSGQYLSIPVRSSQSAKVVQERGGDIKKVRESRGNARYKVQKGDTLFSLAKRFDTSVPEMKRINNIKGNALKVGLMLRFNNKAPAEKEAGNKREAKTYVVKKGDSLKAIAQRNGSKVDKIMQLNNLSNKDNIQPGQVIVVR